MNTYIYSCIVLEFIPVHVPELYMNLFVSCPCVCICIYSCTCILIVLAVIRVFVPLFIRKYLNLEKYCTLNEKSLHNISVISKVLSKFMDLTAKGSEMKSLLTA